MRDNQHTTSNTENQAVKTTVRKRFRGDAIKTLSKASARTVGQNAETIVQKLLDGALKGDLKSAELLITFIEKTPPSKSMKRLRMRQLVERLASEPAWTPPEGPPEDHSTGVLNSESSSGNPSPADALS